MSQGADPDSYLVDADTLSALRRVVRRLRADDPLVGDERRNLASRMGALLQRAQPERRSSGRQKESAEHGEPFTILKEGFWTSRADA